MIFLTVGTQLPFDRLVQAIDLLAAETGAEVFGQIGPSGYKPANFPYVEYIESDEFERKVRQSQFIVSHAGMGSILTAMEYEKVAVLMPREAKLGEHRNDHQKATAARFAGNPYVRVATSIDELRPFFHNWPKISNTTQGATRNLEFASALREFIFSPR